MIKVIAAIPTFNRCLYLDKILGQLNNQSLPPNISLSVVVINDGSTDQTNQILREKHNNVKVIEGDGNWWYTKSINAGLKYALELGKYDFVLTLNDDIEIGNNYVNEIVSVALANKDCVVGSLSVSYEQPHFITFAGVKAINWLRYKFSYYYQKGTLYDPTIHDSYRPTVVLPGRGMLIPLKILKKIGIFKPKYLQYNSDTEFCLRARKNHYGVLISYNAVVYSHHEMTDINSLERNILKVFKSFFNKYSTNYIYNKIDNIYHYGNKFTLPITILILFLGTIKKAVYSNGKL